METNTNLPLVEEVPPSSNRKKMVVLIGSIVIILVGVALLIYFRTPTQDNIQPVKVIEINQTTKDSYGNNFYKNDEFKIEFSYPIDWVISDQEPLDLKGTPAHSLSLLIYNPTIKGAGITISTLGSTIDDLESYVASTSERHPGQYQNFQYSKYKLNDDIEGFYYSFICTDRTGKTFLFKNNGITYVLSSLNPEKLGNDNVDIILNSLKVY